MRKEENQILVRLKGVSKVYGKGHIAVKALNNINLEIKREDFLAIIGPSGSGKTTLLNIIGAIDKPTKGEVILDGVNLAKIKESKLYKVRREKIGFIFQTFYLIPSLSAIENVLLPTIPLGQRRKKFIQKAKKILKTVGLSGKEKRKPNQLSGGEQQRVAIARALILDPLLILADEPTGNLDKKTGMGIVKLMKELNEKEKKTFVIVTHDERITKFCNKIIKIEDGRLI